MDKIDTEYIKTELNSIKQVEIVNVCITVCDREGKYFCKLGDMEIKPDMYIRSIVGFRCLHKKLFRKVYTVKKAYTCLYWPGSYFIQMTKDQDKLFMTTVMIDKLKDEIMDFVRKKKIKQDFPIRKEIDLF